MVILVFDHQIAGDLDIAKDALIQISRRLRANVFDREGAVSAFLPVLPYLPVSADASDGLNYDSRDGKRQGRGHSYSGAYGSSDYAAGDSYGSYGSSQVFLVRRCMKALLHVYLYLDIKGMLCFFFFLQPIFCLKMSFNMI